MNSQTSPLAMIHFRPFAYLLILIFTPFGPVLGQNSSDKASFLNEAYASFYYAFATISNEPLDITFINEVTQDAEQQQKRFSNDKRLLHIIDQDRPGITTSRFLIRIVRGTNGNKAFDLIRARMNSSGQFVLESNVLFFEVDGKQRTITFNHGHSEELTGNFKVSLDNKEEHPTQSYYPSMELPERFVGSLFNRCQGLLGKAKLDPTLLDNVKIDDSKSQIDFLTNDWNYPNSILLNKDVNWLPVSASGEDSNNNEKNSTTISYVTQDNGQPPFPSKTIIQRTFENKPYITIKYRLLSLKSIPGDLKIPLDDPTIIESYQVDRKYISDLIAH